MLNIQLKVSHMHFVGSHICRGMHVHSPSLQNFPWFIESCRKENFCKSAYVSVSRPTINIPLPVLSKGVIVRGARGIECLGELIIITGNDTINTQTACVNTQRRNLHYLAGEIHCDSYLKCPKYGKSYDIPLVILKLLISSDLNYAVK